MIPNIGKEAVNLSRLAANMLEQGEFMKRRHNRLMYYNAETEELTREWFSDNILKNVPIANINITKRVIDRISEVYMIGAKRFFVLGDDKPSIRYNENIPRKDERMQYAEKMTNLLDVVLIHPFWNEDKKILDHETLLEFQPFYNKFGDLVGVRYPLIQDSNTNSIDEQVFVEWNLEGWRIVDVNGMTGPLEPHEGPFPFIEAWTSKPSYFYDHNPTADLVAGNLGINFYETCLKGNIGYQSFGKPYVTGLQPGDSDKLKSGVDNLWGLPDGATAGILSPPNTIEGVISAQKNLYKIVALNYHLSEDFVTGNVQAESGVHLKLRNQELQNERIGDVPRWQNVEAAVYVVERDILSRVGISLPEKLFVDFSESVEYLTPQEQRERDDWDLSHNLITVVDIAMRNNKDLEEADAEALILKNAESVSVIKKTENGRSSIVDEIFGATGG